MWARLRRLDMLIRKHMALVLFLLLVIVLRLPNFFEPYWYGDEGIYLTIGQSLRFGRLLYSQIIDHKTPIIYYLALAPNQLWFRVLLLGWMLTTTFAFYKLSRALIKHKAGWILANLLFIVFTTLPWLEGNLPNGELFVMGFVLVAAAILTKTSYFLDLFSPQTESRPKHQIPRLLIAGGLLGLGILTKVPALFDFLAMLSVAWLSISRTFLINLHKLKISLFIKPLVPAIVVTIGAVIPIFISILYFVTRGSGQAYLDFGLLYNFRYAGSWGLPFSAAWLVFLFSLPGKTLIMAGLGIGITILYKHLKPVLQFSALWFILALFASLLSNRPYPHYFLQIIPPAALFCGAWLEVCFHKGLKEKITTNLVGGSLAALTVAIVVLLGVYFYPTLSYYQNWAKLVTGQISLHDYRQSFNGIMADNYAAAEIIKPCPNPYLFIWGTNPMLYALSQKIPSGRFTVAFHIKDFQAYDETLAAVKATEPSFIVVMKEDEQTFPAFTEYLTSHYMPNTSFDHFTLWRKQ